MKRIGLIHVCVLVLVATALPFAAKPPKPTNTPVSADFRCRLGDVCADRILGDPGGPYIGSLPTMVGAFLTPSYTFTLLLEGSGQSLTMDFTAPVGVAGCVAHSSCRKNFDQFTTYSIPYGSTVIPIDASGDVWPGGLTGMPVATALAARMKINFPDPSGRSLIWTVRFNTRDYPGSGYVSVIRVNSNSWKVSASASSTQLANLVASPSGGAQRQTDEGLYEMPFELTIVKP
jgi:hypothetical protein